MNCSEVAGLGVQLGRRATMSFMSKNICPINSALKDTQNGAIKIYKGV
nr:hypothetical protein [Planktomarina sp.]